MKNLAALMMACILIVGFIGCSEPDVSKQPGAVESTDPGAVKMGEQAPGAGVKK